MLYVAVFLTPFLLMYLYASVELLPQYQRGVVFRLGKVRVTKGPGVAVVIPLLEKIFRIDLRTITPGVSGQDIITTDNYSVRVGAVVSFRVADPVTASIGVENYKVAPSQLGPTTLRSVCGQDDLDFTLLERDVLNRKIMGTLDHETGPWGVLISKVEPNEIDLPECMQRVMGRRAAIINGDGVLRAAINLCEASFSAVSLPADHSGNERIGEKHEIYSCFHGFIEEFNV